MKLTDADIHLVLGMPVEAYPDWPELSPTKTTWSQVTCHHCSIKSWLGERQVKMLTDNPKARHACVYCAIKVYGVTWKTPMGSLTQERKR